MKIANLDLERDVLLVAELSANHNQSLDLALKSVEAIARSGANAIKLQTYTPESITIDCERDDFVINQKTAWDGKKLYDLYKEAMTPRHWHEAIFQKARDLGLICFSSPFSKDDVDFLSTFNPPAYKIASFEITHYELIEHVAKRAKPIIISTGIATLEEIQAAVDLCKACGNNDIVLLQCTSSYPAPLKDAHLANIKDLQKRFGVSVGFSDHTLGTKASMIAVALGARVIEKHFILDKSIRTADSHFSLDEADFTDLAKDIKLAKELIGEVSYEPHARSREFARSIYAIKDIEKGEIFSRDNIGVIRPFFGLHPRHLKDLLGNKSNNKLERGQRLSEDFLHKGKT